MFFAFVVAFYQIPVGPPLFNRLTFRLANDMWESGS